eukprot:TRINITY_DN1348_c0_g1_i5.p1 TRINITY_DN1348_c0_g1~~TRINITY_DN1348_c0_g1_i5.p1  ORF type:complete len:283 (-),score=51.47 TRINITY_DN1348_c0_g1_i5:32-880(-)
MILFWDAVSRAHFNRRLPKTKKKIESLRDNKVSNWFQFFRYHAVGLNTMNNSRALYTGNGDIDLSYPSIFKQFKENGFVEFVSNDQCEDWSAKYRHDFQQFDHENGLFCMPEYHYPADPEGPWIGPFSIKKRCLGPKFVHEYEFEYLEKFWKAYPNSAKFASSTFLEGHEGTGDVLASSDDDFVKFLDFMERENVFNNTAVFIVSDHGLHQGFYWLLFNRGRREHMLPTAYVSLPNWFDQEKQNNMLSAEQKLITAFDLHATFVDLSGGKSVSYTHLTLPTT